MSHSQFHSTNLFILRHAWLNLWDKHMTTGRINQVTTFHLPTSRGTWSKRPLLMVGNHFRGREFITDSWRFKCSVEMLSIVYVLANQHQQMKHLVPRSHKFQTHFSLSKQQRSWPSERTTHNRQRISPRTIMADSQVVNCNRFSYQQVIHSLPSLRCTSRVLDSDRQRQV